MIRYLSANFAHFREQIAAALAPVFDDWDRRAGGRVDRDLIAETLVRFAISELLVRGGRPRNLRRRVSQTVALLGEVLRVDPSQSKGRAAPAGRAARKSGK
jgi:hypothetical protein